MQKSSYENQFQYLKIVINTDEDWDVAPWLMVRWVVGTILHCGPIELFLIPTSDP